MSFKLGASSARPQASRLTKTSSNKRTVSLTALDSDDEAPEAVSLGLAKETVIGRERAVKEFKASWVFSYT